MGRENRLRQQLMGQSARRQQGQRAQTDERQTADMMARPVMVVDRLGRPLQEGDEVALSLDVPLLCMIERMQPMDHDPRIAPGTIVLHLTAQLDVPTMRGMQLTKFILVNRPPPANTADQATDENQTAAASTDAPEGAPDGVEGNAGEPGESGAGAQAPVDGEAGPLDTLEPLAPPRPLDVGGAPGAIVGPQGIRLTDLD